MNATATHKRSAYDLPAPVFYVWYVAHTIRHARPVAR